MDQLIEINRYVHMIVGFAGLAVWWVPILSTKGARLHRTMGKLFVLSAYVIGFTALASPALRLTEARLAGGSWNAILRDAGFLVLLAYLGLFTLNVAHYGVRILRTRRNPETLWTPRLEAMSWLLMAGSVIVAAHALLFWTPVSIILLLLSPIGIAQGLEQRRYMRRRPALKKPWFYAHMDAMLGAGVAFHTAFLVFGSRVVFDLSLLGAFNWVPWVLPAAIGTVFGERWKRSYMRRFGDLPPKGKAVVVS